MKAKHHHKHHEHSHKGEHLRGKQHSHAYHSDGKEGTGHYMYPGVNLIADAFHPGKGEGIAMREHHHCSGSMD